MEQFCDDVERVMADNDSKFKINTGDFNAKKKKEKKKNKNEEDFKSMEAFGIGERNERGERLIDSAEDFKLTIANTQF